MNKEWLIQTPFSERLCEGFSEALVAYLWERMENWVESGSWLSVCGHYIEDGLHCPDCGEEPPWGCPCDICETAQEKRP